MSSLPMTAAELPVVAPLRGGPVLRWAVLGPGEIAGDFVRALRHTDQRVTAVGSRSADRARAFADAHGVPRAFGSYQDAVTADDVDIVYVATPNAVHRPLAVLAAEAGRHVLIEKPFATDPEDAAAIIEAVRAAGVFAMEAMWSRFLPQTAVIGHLVADGAIGEIRSVYADFGADFSDLVGAPVFDPALGGGALRDIGIYPVWLARWLLGPHRRLTATGTMTASGVDEQVAVVLDHDGSQSVLHTTMLTDTPTTAVINGTRGRIEIDRPFLMPSGFVLHDAAGQALPWRDPTTLRGRDGLAWQAVAIARHVADGLTESPWHTLADALALTTTLSEARRAVAGT